MFVLEKINMYKDFQNQEPINELQPMYCGKVHQITEYERDRYMAVSEVIVLLFDTFSILNVKDYMISLSWKDIYQDG